jgi:hypothetical protein
MTESKLRIKQSKPDALVKKTPFDFFQYGVIASLCPVFGRN